MALRSPFVTPVIDERVLVDRTSSGLPLLIAGIATPPRLPVGWPKAPYLPAKRSLLPGEAKVPGLPVPSGSPIKRPSSPPKPNPIPAEMKAGPSTPREFARLIITEQDADKLGDKEYLGMVRYLLGSEDDFAKYQIFSHMYPDNTVPFLIRVSDQSLTPADEDKVDTGNGQWYQTDDGYGARVKIMGGDEYKFFAAIEAKLTAKKGVGIFTTYNEHANMVWISPERQIWRYEPATPAGGTEQRSIDSALRMFYQLYMPSFRYNPHRLELWQCVQGVRGRNRIHKSDYFCQDYSLLYLKRRAAGMSHEEAAFDMVAKGDSILQEIEELMYDLAMEYR